MVILLAETDLFEEYKSNTTSEPDKSIYRGLLVFESPAEFLSF
jgi:hypothetical protein